MVLGSEEKYEPKPKTPQQGGGYVYPTYCIIRK
ncbi:MAG: hypothetical protein S4CHLAM2_09560 [Chlamydiales bacterium]|nr:hypothetical protein [Chlamydiales bacterium]